MAWGWGGCFGRGPVAGFGHGLGQRVEVYARLGDHFGTARLPSGDGRLHYAGDPFQRLRHVDDATVASHTLYS